MYKYGNSPGQYFDAESEMHYNYFRDYDPRTGRYVQPDPIGIMNGENHLYSYVRNNPINKTDPAGLIEAGYGGWEAQVVFGFGESTVTCCDGNNIRKLKYRKICFGAGFGGGISGGAAFKSQGPSCKNPPQHFRTGEFGIPLLGMPFFGGLGAEGGIAVTDKGDYATFVGGTWGIGGKATYCYYWLVDNKVAGCCN